MREKSGEKQVLANSGRWRPGKSGNPAGRPRGSGKVAELRSQIAESVPAIISKLVEKAKDGDASAARLLLERVIAPLKPNEEPVLIKLPDGPLASQGRAVLAAVGLGKISTSQAASLLQGIAAAAKTAEIEDLSRRVAAVERSVAGEENP